MSDDILDSISYNLFSIPPLVFRSLRRKLLRTALSKIDVDISPLHFEIMKLLEESGTLHAAEIGERLQIARAQMTHLIDKLADLNLVERQNNTSDRRTVNITLTDTGKTLIEENDKAIRNVIKEALDNLTGEEIKELSTSLTKLRDILVKIQ
jgi:MarR family 2-MHQ and catechol resistance regulon transcriptional repressor